MQSKSIGIFEMASKYFNIAGSFLRSSLRISLSLRRYKACIWQRAKPHRKYKFLTIEEAEYEFSSLSIEIYKHQFDLPMQVYKCRNLHFREDVYIFIFMAQKNYFQSKNIFYFQPTNFLFNFFFQFI